MQYAGKERRIQYAGKERRVYERIKHQFITRFRAYPQKGSGESHRWDIATILNLSAGGLFFNCGERLGIGTVVEFKITLPFIVGPTHCLGMVCRVEPVDNSSGSERYRIATYFVKLAEDTKKSINIHAKKPHFRKR